MTESSQWFVRFRGKTAGPFSESVLRDMVKRGELSRMHEVSSDGRLWNRLVHHTAFSDLFSRRSRAAAAVVESEPAAQPEKQYSDEAAREDVNSFLEEASTMENAEPPDFASVAEVQWFYVISERKIGPVASATLRQMFEAGQLPTDTLMWKEGMSEWLPAYRTGLCDRHIAIPDKPQQPAPAKSKGGAADGTVIAGYICCALSVLLCPPAFGIAAFVLAIVNIVRGQSVHGVAQLILSIVLPFIGLIVWLGILAEF